jgi:CHAT domain-containing protein
MVAGAGQLELAAAEREYQNLLGDEQSQGLQKAEASTRLPALNELQAVLPEDAAVIEYVILDNQLALFLLTRAELRVATVEETEANLRARVELLRDLLVQQGRDSWRKPAEGLRRILVNPLEEPGWLAGRRRLYVVPHGVLHHVPYAALLKGDRFLVQDYELAVPRPALLGQ